MIFIVFLSSGEFFFKTRGRCYHRNLGLKSHLTSLFPPAFLRVDLYQYYEKTFAA